MFEYFLKVGIVFFVLFSMMYKSNFGDLNLWEVIVCSKLKVVEVFNLEGLKYFEESIGRKMFKDIYYRKFIILFYKGESVVLGSGYFVCMVRF